MQKGIVKSAVEASTDTIVVLDTCWLVNAGYHINSNSQFQGTYTSHEFLHIIQNLIINTKSTLTIACTLSRVGTWNRLWPIRICIINYLYFYCSICPSTDELQSKHIFF